VPVLLTFDFPPAFGGIQRYIVRLADSLADLGQRVAVVAPQEPGADRYDATLRIPVRRFGGGNRPLRMLRALLAARQAHGAVADGNAATEGNEDASWMIASSWFPAGLVAALLPRKARGRLMILAHGSEVAARYGTLRERLLRWTFARADCIVANSRFTAARVRDAEVRSRVEIVPCGVDEHTIERFPANVPTILFVGRLVPRKGADRLIEALPMLREHLGSAQLEIIGNGPDRDRLERLAAELGVREHVRFLGAVSDTERDAAYARAWCFAMPTRAEGDDVEGFGIVYLEAAMAGLPAIGGSGSGAEDAIADGVTGFVVDGTDRTAVANALLQVLGNPERARAMGEAGRTRALTEFTWKQNAIAIARIMAVPA
jgi:phosphatidylinositol alpha-1,6-mannosyltransferase